MGVLLVDSRGVPVFVNATARRLVAQRDGITIDHGVLKGATAESTQQLGRAVKAATVLAKGQVGAHGVGTVTLPRPSGRSGLRAVVVPAGQAESLLGAEPLATAAVFVSDPEADAIGDAARLARLFGLTDTEGRIASRLANGDTIGDIADALEIRRNTVRWHVKHILQKTHVETQAQLVSLLLRGPAGIR
jgi:DNA-binding CsgD family transcriptional regulator